jgi:diamine N-acetyltransferase
VSLAPNWSATLEGPRVIARSLTEADLSATLEWRNHPLSRPWFKNSEIIDYPAHRDWFREYAERRHEYMFFFVSRDGHLPIGQGGIYAYDALTRCAEIGRFVSDPNLRGRGLFRDGLILMLEYAGANLGLGAVHLEVQKKNSRAIALYRSLGFLDTGCDDSMLQMQLRLDDKATERKRQVERSDNA